MKLRDLGLGMMLLLLAVTGAGLARADAPPAAVAVVKHKLAYPQYVHAQIGTILDTLKTDGDYATAIASLQGLFDQTILYAPADKVDAVREADFALRLVTQLNQVPAETRDALMPYLRQHDNLAQTLVFLIRQDRQRSAGVYELLDSLRQKRGDKLDKYATLAAAICVVHNKPRSIQVNENRATSADPIDLFDYYIKNENRMYFGIKNVPAELLIYVVDTTASINEMQWALDKYAGNAEVGKLFFTIKYDYAYLKSGGKKQLTEKGFNLQNIAQYGGVCADQSYFATTVGKSIGVPTSMDEGNSGEAGHAWVGFLQSNGKTAWWNFDVGRYQSYQGVQGHVIEPQTRQGVPDSYVSLLGEMIATKPLDRQNTVVLTDAAERLKVLEKDAVEVAAPLGDSVSATTFMPKARPRDTAAQLALIDSALRFSAAYTPAWFAVRDLAVAHKLTLADKQHWSDLLLRLGAKKYPDFTLTVLMPMVQSIEDPKEQDTLLTNILPLFSTRMDLSASIRMAQASLWESQNQPDRAGQCYMEVVQRYCNDGPFVLAALAGAEKLLKAEKRPADVLVLYEQAWGRTKKPVDFAPEFVAQSNWFRIGKLYAQKQKDAGDTTKAAEVEATLGVTAKGS